MQGREEAITTIGTATLYRWRQPPRHHLDLALPWQLPHLNHSVVSLSKSHPSFSVPLPLSPLTSNDYHNILTPINHGHSLSYPLRPLLSPPQIYSLLTHHLSISSPLHLFLEISLLSQHLFPSHIFSLILVLLLCSPPLLTNNVCAWVRATT